MLTAKKTSGFPELLAREKMMIRDDPGPGRHQFQFWLLPPPRHWGLRVGRAVKLPGVAPAGQSARRDQETPGDIQEDAAGY